MQCRKACIAGSSVMLTIACMLLQVNARLALERGVVVAVNPVGLGRGSKWRGGGNLQAALALAGKQGSLYSGAAFVRVSWGVLHGRTFRRLLWPAIAVSRAGDSRSREEL